MDPRNGECATASLFKGALTMEYTFPAFLYLTLGAWLTLSLLFVGFSIYLIRLPDDEILRIQAKAIENKKRLGIKIYKF